MGFKSYLAKNKTRITKIYILISTIVIVSLILTLIIAFYMSDPVIIYYTDKEQIHEYMTEKEILDSTRRFFWPVLNIIVSYYESRPGIVNLSYANPFVSRYVEFNKQDNTFYIKPLFGIGLD